MPCPANCTGHGVCALGQCFCEPGYKGEDCATVDPCPGGCSGRGSCLQGACACAPGYGGMQCEADGCGADKTNTSSPCWVDCFYKAALGPEAGRPGGAVAGMPMQQLVAAWQKPFLPEAEGGCPAQPAASPWFEAKPPIVEA